MKEQKRRLLWPAGMTAMLVVAMMAGGCKSKEEKARIVERNSLLSSRDIVPPPYIRPNQPYVAPRPVVPAPAPIPGPAPAIRGGNMVVDGNTVVPEPQLPGENVPMQSIVHVQNMDDGEPLFIPASANSVPQPPVSQDEVAAFMPPPPPPIAEPPKAAPSRPLPPPPAVKHGADRPLPPPPTPAAGGSRYTVVAGDSLSAIGQRYHVNWMRLAKYNNLDPKAPLKIGQVIQIPDTATKSEPSKPVPSVGPAPTEKPHAAAELPADGIYTVVSGDNIWVIGKRFHVKRDDIRAWNNLSTDNLKVGQKLRLRGDAKAAPAPGPAPRKVEPAPQAANPAPATPAVNPPAAVELETPAPAAETQVPENKLTPLPEVAPGAAAALENPAPAATANAAPANNGVKLLKHIVVAGDTLEKIAGMYGCTIEALKEHNPKVQVNDDLTPGMELMIPYLPN